MAHNFAGAAENLKKVSAIMQPIDLCMQEMMATDNAVTDMTGEVEDRLEKLKS